MAQSDSRNCVEVCGSEQKATSHRAQSSVENKRSRQGRVFKPTELQLQGSYNRGKLHLTPRDWQQLLKVEKRVAKRCELVDDILVFPAGMG